MNLIEIIKSMIDNLTLRRNSVTMYARLPFNHIKIREFMIQGCHFVGVLNINHQYYLYLHTNLLDH